MDGGREHLQAWLEHRGEAPGALFCPVRQAGEIPITRMRGESLASFLRRRQEQAGIEPFSPHDLRRSTVTHLLDAGVDVFTVQKLTGHEASQHLKLVRPKKTQTSSPRRRRIELLEHSSCHDSRITTATEFRVHSFWRRSEGTTRQVQAKYQRQPAGH